MIVYVETNFLLELVRIQEEHDACNEILRLCEQGKITLLIPAFCMSEPHGTLARSRKRRTSLQEKMREAFEQLKRTRGYASAEGSMREVQTLLVTSGEEERARLASMVDRLLEAAVVIALDANILSAASEFQPPLTPQDAIVLSSVVAHIGDASAGHSCFVARDKHFGGESIVVDKLLDLNCKLLSHFQVGLNYIQHQLDRADDE